MNRLYDILMAPLENRWLAEKRSRLIAHASGRVLEIGFGTGANLKYYRPETIVSLTALDRDLPKTSLETGSFPVIPVKGCAEKLPFPDGTFDTVVETLVLCSVSDVSVSLSEIFRVLKPGGQLIFMDHVLPEKSVLAALFKGINVVWPHLAHGCSLTRSPHLSMVSHGFLIRESGSFADKIFRYGIAEKPSELLTVIF